MTKQNINNFVIPPSWIKADLNQVAIWGSGGTPSRSNPQYFQGNIPWIKTGELKSKYIRDTEEKITEQAIKLSSAKVFPKGSVAIAMYGATIGKTSILSIDAASNQACAVAQPIQKIIFNEFLYYYLFSQLGKFIELGKGGAQPNISQTILKSYPIFLPPLSEQYRIVEKIEELFSDLDKGIESLKTTQQQLKIYRQAVLKWAFEGKLTAKWREEKKHKGELKSADELLDQIKAEREKRDRTQLQEWHEAVKTWEANGKQGKKPGKPQKLKELSPLIKANTDSFSKLPEGWVWVHYSDICSQIRNGISAKPNSEIGEKIFRISAVRPFYIDLTDFRCIDNTSGQYNNFLLENGDILFTRYNGSRKYVGVCAKFESDKRFLYPDKLIKTKLISSELLCADYIMFASNIGSSRAFIDSRIRTTAGQSGISGDDIKSMPIPICSTEEQHQIVQEIEFRLSICDRLEATITENLTRAEALRQSILKQAFEGKLVPQDPNDEPAEKLIERIRQEKLNGKNGKQLELEVFVDVEDE